MIQQRNCYSQKVAWSSASAHISLIDWGGPGKTVSFEFETTKAQTSRYPRLLDYEKIMHVINETRRLGNDNILQLQGTGSYNWENITNCFHRDHSILNTVYSSLLSFMYSSLILHQLSQPVGDWETCQWVVVFYWKPTDSSLVDCSFPIRNTLRLSDLLD